MHSAGVAVDGLSMSDKIAAEHIFLVVEGNFNESGTAEQGYGYIRGAKMIKSDYNCTSTILKGDKRVSLPLLQ